MIEIIENKDNIIISGHAGYAPKGYDIVCSAISILTLTLVESLQRLTAYSEEVIDKDGYVEIETKALSRDAEFLIQAFFIGVMGVATIYPKHIKVSRRATH